MSDINKFTKQIIKFRDERDWKQFHNPKDIALSLVLEATEFMEHFQWKNGDELQKYIKESKEAIGDELADVLYWVLLISNDLDIDIAKSLKKKMKKNEEKYPTEKARGKNTKYNKL